MRRLAWLLVFLPAVVSAQNTYPPLVKVVPFASLSTAANNGTINYCSDCDTTDPCAGGGSGAFAFRVNGAWSCAVSGAVGAPTAAEYIVAAAHAGLSAERVCTDTATIDCDAGTANQMKFNIVSPLTTQLVGVVGCAAPPFSFNGDLNAGLCLPAVNGIVVQPALYTGTSVGYFYGTDAASALFFTDAGAQTSGWQASTDTIGGYINGVQELDFTPGSYRFGFGGLHDQIRIVPGGPGAGVFTGSITGADLTGNRTYAAPDADATFVQPITCGGTDKISAISGVGLATCSADGGAAAGSFVPGSSSPAVDAANGVWGISNGLVFEGLTADDFETTLTPVDPLVDTTINVPTGHAGTLAIYQASSAAPTGTDCDTAAEGGRLYHQIGDPATINNQYFRCAALAGPTYGWQPIGHFAGTACPATCTAAAGGLCYDTDDDLLKSCTADNTWTTVAGGSFVSPGLGIIVDTDGVGTLENRTLAAADGIVIANPAGTAGNPSISVDSATVPRYVTGTATPSGTCQAGRDFYIETDANKLWSCTSTDTWTDTTAAGGTVDNSIVSGRLTLTTGVPVTTSDVTAATNIYYAPYKGNRIALYSGSAWEVITFSEVTCALGTLTADKNYDVFIYSNGGTATCEFSAAWTNDSTRADALARQDGVLVKSGTTTRRYVGTFRTISTTQTADSGGGTTTQVGGKRFLWNQDNRVSSWLRVMETTNSWTYGSASWRVANGATGPLNCVEFVAGDIGDRFQSTVLTFAFHQTAADDGSVGVSYDSTSAPSGLRQRSYIGTLGLDQAQSVGGTYSVTPDIGYHYSCWMESATAATNLTFYGDNNGSIQLGGLQAEFTR